MSELVEHYIKSAEYNELQPKYFPIKREDTTDVDDVYAETYVTAG